MKTRKTLSSQLFIAVVALTMAFFGFTTALAQTAPTPTHTFNATTNSTFGTNTNWSLDTLPTTSSHVLIADGKTATMSQTDANTLFGSLTLGVNSIINLAASLKQGPAAGSVIYFNNGSQLNYTSGDVNRSATYNILSGATAQMKLSGTTAGDSLPQGSLVGDSTTTVNFMVVNLTNLRWNANSFAGTINYQSSDGSSARSVVLTNFSEGGNKTGTGTTNFANLVRGTLVTSNDMNDSGTLKLTGSSGGASNVKFDIGANTDTIAGFVIDSPSGATATAPTLRGSNSLTVSGTTTFQGTAGNINFDSSNATPSSHNLLNTGSMTFGGTGTWAVAGDGVIRLNAASGTRTITTDTNASIANTLAGTQGFTKQGASTLTLTGTNSYTGGTSINAGTLAFANGSLGSLGNITFGGNSTLQWASGNTQDVSGRIVMNNSVISSLNTNGNDVSFVSGIGSSTSGALTKTGTGKLTLQASATYTGATTISDGMLEIWSTLASSGIVNNAALIFDNALSQSYNNAISGSGTFTKKGAGAFTLAGSNSYSGGTTLSAGTLVFADGSLGTIGNITFGGNSALKWASSNTQDVSGRIVMSNSIISTFDTNGNDVSFVSGIGSSTSGALTKTGTGKLTLQASATYTGATTISDGTLEIWTTLASSGIVNNAALIFDNALSQSYNNAISGSGTFTKKGAGMLTLSAANTYTGATQVTGGALNIASTGSTDVNSAVTVSNSGSAIIVNGTLGGSLLAEAGTAVSGTGTISGNTTIEGIHNPGNSPGIQTYVSDLTYSGGSSVVNWELNGNSTTNSANPNAIFDQIVVGGNLDFTNLTTINLIFNGSGSAVDWDNALWASNQTWTIYDLTAGTTSGFSNLQLVTTNWLDGNGLAYDASTNAGGTFALGQDGNDVVLNYTAYVIPEPKAALLGGLGILLLLRRRR